MAQHDILVRSLKEVAEDAEGENGGWKIKLLNAQDIRFCAHISRRGRESGMNSKTKAVPRRKCSKGWAMLSEACKGTPRRRMSEGLVGQCILAKRLRLAFWCRKGSLWCDCPSIRSSGVDGKAHCGPTYGIG
jgi:hypothetical protein